MYRIELFVSIAVLWSCLIYDVGHSQRQVDSNVTALILARGGSKGIKLKNLVQVGNRSILRRSLDAIGGAAVFDQVWVSTDHPLISKEALEGGARVHNRSAESATDTATSIFAVQEFLHHHPEVEVLALIQCTSPFVNSEYLKQGFLRIQSGKVCVFSVTRSFKLRWKESDDALTPINFHSDRRPRRQDWNGELVENGMFYIAKRELLMKGFFQNDKCSIVEVKAEDSLELDEPWQLEVARSIAWTRESPQIDHDCRNRCGFRIFPSIQRWQIVRFTFDSDDIGWSTSFVNWFDYHGLFEENLNKGSVPQYYREIFDMCSPSGAPINRDIFQTLLKLTGLDSSHLEKIWEYSGSNHDVVSRNCLYRCLALIAWAQQGKELSRNLLENFSGQELPVPNISNLSTIKDMTNKLSGVNVSKLNMTYTDLKRIDTISIDRVPERIGIILKHSEYIITSQRFKVSVRRRYNDFLALHELLLARFPYRLIPRLPPKKIIVSDDSHFLEERRKGLLRWLNLIARHPIISQDPLVSFFLRDQGNDVQHRIKEMFRRAPDEFMTSELSARAKDLVPPETNTEFSSSRDQIRSICLGVSKLKQIFDLNTAKNEAFVNNMHDLGVQLSVLGNEPLPHSDWATGGNNVWQNIKKGFLYISKEFSNLSVRGARHASIFEERVSMGLASVLDMLYAHQDMCERLEHGVLSDHNTALNKMLALKKRRMKGVIRGQDTESVDSLEQRMLEQEAAISSLELRHAFSLYCAQLETQLIHLHLTDLATVFNAFVEVNLQSHSEMADVWKQIQPIVNKFLPENKNS